jgi:hypothetical protein
MVRQKNFQELKLKKNIWRQSYHTFDKLDRFSAINFFTQSPKLKNI